MINFLNKGIEKYKQELAKKGLKMEYRLLDDSVVYKDGKPIGIVPRKHYLATMHKLKEWFDLYKALELYKDV